jgi:hypothetical protein
MVRLHNENQLDSLPGSASKVPVVVGGWWWLSVNLVIGFSASQTKVIRLFRVALFFNT